jgi:hypothetical protein
VSIYTDNQSTIKELNGLNGLKASSGQYLIREIIREASESPAALTVNWISGHSGVKGNERADCLAKEAASGDGSRRGDLPTLLQRELPASASATKEDFMETLNEEWRDAWAESPRKRKTELFDESFPFKDFQKKRDKLTRGQASLLMQVRTGHIPLNSYLAKIGKSDTAYCGACAPALAEEGHIETVNHFLFHCAAFNEQRHTEVIGRDHLNLQDIMEDEKRMKALANYIRHTRRFDNVNW